MSSASSGCRGSSSTSSASEWPSSSSSEVLEFDDPSAVPSCSVSCTAFSPPASSPCWPLASSSSSEPDDDSSEDEPSKLESSSSSSSSELPTSAPPLPPACAAAGRASSRRGTIGAGPIHPRRSWKTRATRRWRRRALRTCVRASAQSPPMRRSSWRERRLARPQTTCPRPGGRACRR